jgi:hypothetical protein
MRGGVKCESSRGQAIGSAEPQLSPSRATYLVDVRTAVAEGKGVVLFPRNGRTATPRDLATARHASALNQPSRGGVVSPPSPVWSPVS